LPAHSPPSSKPQELESDRPTQASLADPSDDSDDDSLTLKVATKPRPMPRAKEREVTRDPDDPESSKPL
jgi:hypothetical protein